MGFGDRTAKTEQLIRIVDERIWSVPPLDTRIALVPYGYETHVDERVRQALRYVRSRTSIHIRFTPDYFLVDRGRPEQVYLFDYKATQTPLYSANRLRDIRTRNSLPTLILDDVGQMEAEAYDNYIELSNIGVRVAVLNYCAYHARPLLFDFITNIQVVHRDVVTGITTTGSRTPFINFDCNSMRSLRRFVYDEHGIALDEMAYTETCEVLGRELPVTHASGSPLHPRNTRR